MARCRKSYDEQISVLDEQIARVQEKLENLIEQRESIMARKREAEIGVLYQILQENGLSTQDILNMINIQEQVTA